MSIDIDHNVDLLFNLGKNKIICRLQNCVSLNEQNNLFKQILGTILFNKQFHVYMYIHTLQLQTILFYTFTELVLIYRRRIVHFQKYCYSYVANHSTVLAFLCFYRHLKNTGTWDLFFPFSLMNTDIHYWSLSGLYPSFLKEVVLSAVAFSMACTTDCPKIVVAKIYLQQNVTNKVFAISILASLFSYYFIKLNSPLLHCVIT